jgi:hypothetical protein
LNLPLNISALSLPLPTASPQFIDLYHPGSDAQAGQATAQELADGLTAAAASVSPKFFYNELGSKLFEAITGLDEYYPTRTEAGIFEAAHSDIAATLAAAGITRPCLIDLGAGNCAKAMTLIPAPAAAPVRAGRYLRRVFARRGRAGAKQLSGAGHRRRGHGFFGRADVA